MTGGEKDKQNDARDEGLNWRESTGGIVCHVGQRAVLLCIVVLYQHLEKVDFLQTDTICL